MGMLDDKMYLTGDHGAVNTGDTFLLRGAKVTGEVSVGGKPRTEVALRIERSQDDAPIVVFTTGAAIVNQVQRMDMTDQAMMKGDGMPVKLVQRGGDAQRNPAYVLAAPDAPDTDSGGFSAAAPSEGDW